MSIKMINKLDIVSQCSLTPDGTWLKRECPRFELVSWSTRSGFSIVGHKEGPVYMVLSLAMVAIRFKQRSWNSLRAKRPPWFQKLYV